ncbi:MAG: lipid-A-disaccharide synthase [Granulosicoccaceae bacterium]
MTRLMISAGEASGDIHAAAALQALSEQGHAVECFGMGGSALEAQGMELVVDNRDLSVIGFVDVLRNYGKFKRRLETLRQRMREEKPALLLTVDYPDFNLKLAETARELDVPVLHYVSPQVWAWREGRITRIGSLVTHMAVLFPFEVPYYERHNIPVTYVGHPLLDEIHDEFSSEEARERLGIKADNCYIGLMPGSRPSELTRILPTLLKSAELLLEKNPHLQFLLPLAPSLDATALEPFPELKSLPVKVVKDDSHVVAKACDAIAVASGTATLELALLGRPMVVVYKLNPINYAIMRRLIKIPHISLVNIVAGREVCKELVQAAATPRAVSTELHQLLDDNDYRQTQIAGLQEIKDQMGEPGASGRVAKIILDLLHANRN